MYICTALRDAIAGVSVSIMYVSRGLWLFLPYPRTKHWNRPPFGTSLMRNTSTTNPAYLYFFPLFPIFEILPNLFLITLFYIISRIIHRSFRLFDCRTNALANASVRIRICCTISHYAAQINRRNPAGFLFLSLFRVNHRCALYVLNRFNVFNWIHIIGFCGPVARPG